jgi:Na+/glutamate symporter
MLTTVCMLLTLTYTCVSAIMCKPTNCRYATAMAVEELTEMLTDEVITVTLKTVTLLTLQISPLNVALLLKVHFIICVILSLYILYSCCAAQRAVLL